MKYIDPAVRESIWKSPQLQSDPTTEPAVPAATRLSAHVAAFPSKTCIEAPKSPDATQSVAWNRPVEVATNLYLRVPDAGSPAGGTSTEPDAIATVAYSPQHSPVTGPSGDTVAATGMVSLQVNPNVSAANALLPVQFVTAPTYRVASPPQALTTRLRLVPTQVSSMFRVGEGPTHRQSDSAGTHSRTCVPFSRPQSEHGTSPPESSPENVIDHRVGIPAHPHPTPQMIGLDDDELDPDDPPDEPDEEETDADPDEADDPAEDDPDPLAEDGEPDEPDPSDPDPDDDENPDPLPALPADADEPLADADPDALAPLPLDEPGQHGQFGYSRTSVTGHPRLRVIGYRRPPMVT